jgi:hypothetical protein
VNFRGIFRGALHGDKIKGGLRRGVLNVGEHENFLAECKYVDDPPPPSTVRGVSDKWPPVNRGAAGSDLGFRV